MRAAAPPVAVLLCCAALGGGCTQIRVYNSDSTQVHSVFGLTRIVVAPTARPTLIQTRAAGLWSGQNQLGLGFLRQEMAAFPDPSRCALMIFVPDHMTAERLRAQISISNKAFNPNCISERAYHAENIQQPLVE